MDELAKNHAVSQPIPHVGTSRLVVVHASLKTKHPDRYKKLVESYKAAFHNPAYQDVLKKTGQAYATQFMEPDEANALWRSLSRMPSSTARSWAGDRRVRSITGSMAQLSQPAKMVSNQPEPAGPRGEDSHEDRPRR